MEWGLSVIMSNCSALIPIDACLRGNRLSGKCSKYNGCRTRIKIVTAADIAVSGQNATQ